MPAEIDAAQGPDTLPRYVDPGPPPITPPTMGVVQIVAQGQNGEWVPGAKDTMPLGIPVKAPDGSWVVKYSASLPWGTAYWYAPPQSAGRSRGSGGSQHAADFHMSTTPTPSPDLLTLLANGVNIKFTVTGTMPGENLMVAFLTFLGEQRATMNQANRDIWDGIAAQQAQDLQHIWRGIWHALGVV